MKRKRTIECETTARYSETSKQKQLLGWTQDEPGADMQILQRHGE
ncbi:MAG: hypothetical protein VX249_12235 [Pseudomonadota bacterium]|nr:hypothetical protein [Pseudomonadota bacterium]